MEYRSHPHAVVAHSRQPIGFRKNTARPALRSVMRAERTALIASHLRRARIFPAVMLETIMHSVSFEFRNTDKVSHLC
jgi:hypothetical protein